MRQRESYKITGLCLQVFLFFFMGWGNYAHAQSGLCTPDVPFYTADLSHDPEALWESQPPIVRSGSCCDSKWPDRCIEFEVTLHPDAVALNFEILSGAIPSGSMFYQLECGPPVPVGEPICIDGPGPHTITFCKPGSNLNTYGFTSIPGPRPTPDDTASDGCNAMIYTSGLDENTIQWTDLTGGGAYESYLNCKSGCDTAIVTSQPGAPPYADYQVCGEPLSKCSNVTFFCDTVRVYFIPPMEVKIMPDPPSYCANTTGILLNGSVTGGDGNYSIKWTDGPNGTGNVVNDSLNFFASSPGTYSLTVTDGTYPECPAKTTNVDVTVDPVPNVDLGADFSVCADNPEIKLNGDITGATTGEWSGGAGTFSPDKTSPFATYTPTTTEIQQGKVTLTYTTTDNGACAAASDDITIAIVPKPKVVLNAPPLCDKGTSLITATVTGGQPPYNYKWSSGETTASIVKPEGTYNVVVTDALGANNCAAVASVTIKKYPPLQVDVSPANVVMSCDSILDITSVVSGGAGDYSYQWNTGQTTPSISVNPGEYSVTITDSVGCTATDNISVIAANSNLVASIAEPPPLCNGTNTNITVTANGGFGNNSYLWSTNQGGETITVGPGSYCATVTDEQGCKTTACVDVTENPALTAGIDASDTVVCKGGMADLSAFAKGGVPPYTYEWNTGEKAATVTKPAGTYTLTVTDASQRRCADQVTIIITEADEIIITMEQTDVSCNGGSNGSATANVIGGVAPYNYSWSPVGGSGPTASGLPAGEYTLTVTDGIGCTKTNKVTINQPAALSTSITGKNNISCFGGSDGSATVSASGGITPYEYLWSPSGASVPKATGLPAGTHIVTVTDNRGCAKKLTVVLTEPTQVKPVLASKKDVSCNGSNDGTASVAVSGGTPEYSYLWSPVGGIGAQATGLAAGNYTVKVTDKKGCNKDVQLTIDEPEPMILTVTATDVSCNGENDGSVSVTVSGGKPMYIYNWTPSGADQDAVYNLGAANYEVTVTDASGCSANGSATINEEPPLEVDASPTTFVSCDDTTVQIYATATGGDGTFNMNWSNGANSDTVNGVDIGLHTIQVIDGKGCRARDTVGVYPLDSDLRVEVTGSEIICPGSQETLIALATGGVGVVSYEWDSGETTNSILAGVGNHCVTVTDADGCSYTDCVILEEDDIDVRIIADTMICKGTTGNINADADGIAPPYTYLWNTGESTASISKPPGTYTVTVSNSASCQVTASVTISEIPEMNIDLTNVFHVTCFGGKDGSVTSGVTGGVGPYSYSWSPVASDLPGVYKVGAGTYTVKVTDAIGCLQTESVEIRQPATALKIDNVIATHVLCYGEETGSVEVKASGGDPPYNYNWWSTGDTTAVIDGIGAGVYEVSVGDTNGCVVNGSVTVNQPAKALEATIANKIDVSCNGAANGSLTVGVTGGTKEYSYSWSPKGGTKATTEGGLEAGMYSVLVTDANGCRDSIIDIEITEPDPIVTSIPESTDVNCEGDADGAARVEASGGVPGYTYNWIPSGATGSRATGLSEGQHYVEVTDDNGCVTRDTVEIGVSSQPDAGFRTESVCLGTPASFVNSSSAGTYTWEFGDGTTSNKPNPMHTYSTKGTYNVCLVVTNNGCVDFVCEPLVVGTPPDICFKDSLTGCSPYTVDFDSCITDADSCFWDFGDGTTSTSCNPNHTYTKGGCFDVTISVKSKLGCMTTIENKCYVKVIPSPVAEFEVDPEEGTVFEPEFNFTDLSEGAASWLWLFDDGDTSFVQHPSHSFENPGEHCTDLIVNNEFNCHDTANHCITIGPSWSFYVPNVFTPNKREGNETFIGQGIGITEHRMWIYDRWGLLIYKTDDSDTGEVIPWNGRMNGDGVEMQEDTYVYVVEVKDIFGEYHNFVGHVTLIR